MIEEKLLIASISSSAGGVLFAVTDAVSIAIVTQLGALALAGLAAYVSWRTHKAVNSRMDEFKVMFARAKIDEGVLQEKADEAKRKGEVAVGLANLRESRLEQAERTQAAPSQVAVSPSSTVSDAVGVAKLAKAVGAVPEKTAVKVVDKLEELNGG